ncbi:purine-cytosine permease family protein [Paenibacillus jiagnxiensis]|uniref:purine-cytosine permease family protein n=1 Tax=Paenibacillus jiagnxiensis TaxID=3228926 RepID=UPI0033B39028
MKWYQGPTRTTRSEHIEDYAIRKIPSYYRWPVPAIIAVLHGNSTAMFFYTFGAQMGFYVGWPQMLWPLMYMLAGAAIVGTVLIRLASKEGLTIDLMTRGMGFGYMGSAVTSFIYGLNYVFYFLFEGTIVTHAISIYFNVHFNTLQGTVIFALLGLVKLLFVWYGMKGLQIFQTWGVLLYALLLGYCLFRLFQNYEIAFPRQWGAGEAQADSLWLAFMLANGQMVFQGLMATDYGRFAKEEAGYRGGFLIMLGMLLPMAFTILCGPLFAYTLLPFLHEGGGYALAVDPGYVFPTIMGIWGVLFVLITQFRINVMNLYSGSLALSNTFSLAFRFTPGRQFWMIIVYLIGCIVYSFNIVQYLDKWMAVTGVLTNTWIVIALTDHFICRKLLRLGPTDFIEYRRPFLYRWNPTGLTALSSGVAVGAIGIAGAYPVYFASFVAMLVGMVLHLLLTAATGGKYYFTRFPHDRTTAWVPPAWYRGKRPAGSAITNSVEGE